MLRHHDALDLPNPQEYCPHCLSSLRREVPSQQVCGERVDSGKIARELPDALDKYEAKVDHTHRTHRLVIKSGETVQDLGDDWCPSGYILGLCVRLEGVEVLYHAQAKPEASKNRS